jgi:hypothetical protein
MISPGGLAEPDSARVRGNTVVHGLLRVEHGGTIIQATMRCHRPGVGASTPGGGANTGGSPARSAGHAFSDSEQTVRRIG